jgi:hypothetical protein
MDEQGPRNPIGKGGCERRSRGAFVRRAIALWLSVGILCAPRLSAAQDAAQLVPQASLVQTARVVLVDPSAEFRARLSEARMEEVGCTLVTRDSRHIAGLVDVLRHASLGMQPAPLVWDGEPREAIYLRLADGSETSFLLERAFLNKEGVGGLFTHAPRFDHATIRGGHSLPRDLALWAADMGPPSTTQPHYQTECEAFMADVRGQK